MGAILAHLSDPHVVPSGRLLYGQNPGERLALGLRHLVSNYPRTASCILSGDLANHGDGAAYAELRDLIEPLPIPFNPVLGNHDDFAAFQQVFPEHRGEPPGFLQYEADLGGVRLLVLDSRDREGRGPRHSGLFCTRRLGWLRERLAYNRGPVLIAMHHPPMPVGIPSMDAIALQNPEDFLDTVSSGSVRPFLLLGHVHRNLSGIWRGLPFFCTAGVSHQIALDLDHTYPILVSTEPPSYALILVDRETVTAHRVGFAEPGVTFPLTDFPS